MGQSPIFKAITYLVCGVLVLAVVATTVLLFLV